MGKLEDYRREIDAIDDKIAALYAARMAVCRKIGEEKAKDCASVAVPGREKQIVNRVTADMPDEIKIYAKQVFTALFDTSKAYQSALVPRTSAVVRTLEKALKEERAFPVSASVACQGVEGAYSGIAAEKIFPISSITYFKNFEGVFNAVEKGLCEYGVLPIENSTAGSVNAVYDLLAQFDFHIVRSLRLKIDHNLLAKPDTKLADVREVYSHGQAIAQCAGFIEGHGLHATKYPNTAMSAEMVANSERTDVAAIASRSCAALYGLEVLEPNIQDSDNNYTRFVVISREPRVYPGANRTSLMITTANEPGALYRVLERFYALNINLIKLESRPIPGHDFEFMFYFDLDCPFGSKALDDLLDSIDDVCESFTYFGSYTEVL